MSEGRKIFVGSRKSELALIQTKHVISLLKDRHPDKDFEIVTMSTLGDKILDIPLPKIGEKSLFTKELEAALISGQVDFVVHSLKDLPTALPEGMAIGAVLTREDPRDALVLKKGSHPHNLSTLPRDSVIGTSSLRRAAQLAKRYPHLKVENIRGNLNTRLKKLDDMGKYQAIILATAGLVRIGWSDRITKILSDEEILYAAGQGALAVECRYDNREIIELLEPLYDLQTTLQVIAERSFLKTLGGGCSAPVAVSCKLRTFDSEKFKLTLNGAVWSLDGKEEITDTAAELIAVNKDLRCADCPYRNNLVKDIENLDCGKCAFKGDEEPDSKRAKLDVPPEVLQEDPHDLCPIQIPIGADFMGKCPYLENKDMIDMAEIRKCPFFKKEFVIEREVVLDHGESSGEKQDNLFCGLVLHKDASKEGMKKAVGLGEKLAKNLIEKGALEVMAKAQAIVHDQVAQSLNIVAS